MENAFKFDPYIALKSLVEVTSTHIGNEFIKITANEIKKLFDADLVFITKANNYSPTTNVDVLYSTDDSFPNSFDLEGTPCHLVYNNEIVQITEGVNKNFIEEKNTDFESFYGIPISNENNLCIGHIAIYSCRKRDFPNELEDIATIYSRKIQTEAKRYELELENEKIRRELEELIITDPLTKLHNRRYFNKLAEDVFAQVKRGTIKATLAYLDLDNFKLINDFFGHDGGDEVLVELSNILNTNSRKGVDNIFRLGGEEFCIITINSDLKQANMHLERIMKACKKHFEYTKFGEITLSVGIVEFEDSYENFEEVLKVADERMYIAKKTGKDKIVDEN